MKRLWIIGLLIALPSVVRAQLAPLPPQTSTAYEAAHLFSGSVLSTLCVNWHNTGTARWLMLVDTASATSNGTITTVWCQPITAVGTPADQFMCFDWTPHPLIFSTGVTAVVSSHANGCTTLTKDGNNSWFTGQVR